MKGDLLLKQSSPNNRLNDNNNPATSGKACATTLPITPTRTRSTFKKKTNDVTCFFDKLNIFNQSRPFCKERYTDNLYNVCSISY